MKLTIQALPKQCLICILLLINAAIITKKSFYILDLRFAQYFCVYYRKASDQELSMFSRKCRQLLVTQSSRLS